MSQDQLPIIIQPAEVPAVQAEEEAHVILPPKSDITDRIEDALSTSSGPTDVRLHECKGCSYKWCSYGHVYYTVNGTNHCMDAGSFHDAYPDIDL